MKTIYNETGRIFAEETTVKLFPGSRTRENVVTLRDHWVNDGWDWMSHLGQAGFTPLPGWFNRGNSATEDWPEDIYAIGATDTEQGRVFSLAHYFQGDVTTWHAGSVADLLLLLTQHLDAEDRLFDEDFEHLGEDALDYLGRVLPLKAQKILDISQDERDAQD